MNVGSFTLFKVFFLRVARPYEDGGETLSHSYTLSLILVSKQVWNLVYS